LALGLVRKGLEQALEARDLVGQRRDLAPARGRGALLARQQPLSLDLERGHPRLFLPALGVEAVDLALERLLAREILGQPLLGEPVLAEQPPVAAGGGVE